ncbi:hypothetical protein BDW59DRAFT_162854 [Aspergillus cavernicola]|uniref:Uncharacterized protein n=1 Tax=Aspergillus cavernicola TaxID=176166 RepID=A0ABR4I808_9EURO
MATDPDGDSQMASSPESNHSHSDIEEPQPGTRTPTNHTHTTLPQFAGASELSPPGSQTQVAAGIADLGMGNPSAEQVAAEPTQRPGASWLNKRADEDYQRAMDHLDRADIHFTPVKNSNAPHTWERKPSTSYLARSKPRKVWKRFRSSFNSMKALQQLTAPGADSLKESELSLEINTQRNAGDIRGIKRQCLGVQWPSTEDESVETCSVRGRSFLETKWESEVSRKRRKLPANTNSTDKHMMVGGLQTEEDEEMTEIGDLPGGTTSTGDSAVQNFEETDESPMLTPDTPDFGAAYPHALPGEAGRLPNEQRGVIVNIKSLDHSDQEEIQTSTTTSARDGTPATEDESDVATVENQQPRPDVATITTGIENQVGTMPASVQLTTEQESTLVRSALRSSLSGEDTELLNNFLSKAKAKREAKAAAEAEAAVPPTIAQDYEETEQPQSHPQVAVEIPTPERRVLEALDANSSSPQKSPSKSPSKSAGKDENSAGTESPPTSPVARRSTRVRSLQRAAAPSAFRTTLSLRRARGTEFVFLQRTEAQELALLTRKNTRQNKGESLLPKFTLQGLARRTPDSSPASDDNIHKGSKPKKYVSWNEERLAEFEGDKGDDELANQDAKVTAAESPEKKGAASSRNPESQASLKTGGEKDAAAATTAATTAAPRGRRVRRLGPPKVDSTTFDALSSPLSPTSASPIAKRTKLTPKSPKSTLTTRTPSKVLAAASNERPSLLSGGRSVKTNLLKVNAGSTPMPRRVRRA